MAAGGYGRGARIPLQDRVRTDRPPPVPAAAEPASDEAGRHCWVAVAGLPRRPGLLVEWRQGPDGWEGRVVYAARLHAGWATVEEWLPASCLDPA